MPPTYRLTPLALLVLATALPTACTRTTASDIELVPIGAEVAVTTQEGAVVQGTLTERDPATVKVAVGTTVRTVPRETIAVAQVVTEESPVVLPPVARFREYTVPAGATLHLRLATSLDSSTSKVDDAVEGTLTEALTVDSTTVAPIGSRVTGVVTAVETSSKHGSASLSFKFLSLVVAEHDAPYTIAADISQVAPSEKKDDIIKIGAPTAVGAIVGGILGGKKGAVIGAVVGGGAGTAVVLTTAGKDVSLPAGTVVTMALTAPVEIRVPLIKGA